MKLFMILAMFSINAFAIGGKPVLYPIDDPNFDMGQMIKRCGKKYTKSNCQDSNGFKRKHAIYREIVINAPIDKVWDVIVDLKRYKSWNPFMPKLSAGFNVGEKIKFTVNMGAVKFWESLWTQAFEKNKRWCWGNKIPLMPGYSQRCRWLKKIGKNKTLYMTTEKFKGKVAGFINKTQRKVLTKGVENEARALKYLAEFESTKFPHEGMVCDGDNRCKHPSRVKGKKEIILQRTFNTSRENLFKWLSDVKYIKKWLGDFHERTSSLDPKNRFGKGHVRRIDAPFVGITDETITIAQYPWHIRYRATQSSMMSHHQGDMMIHSLGKNKSELFWVISFDSKWKSSSFLKWFTETFLKGGLRKLNKKINKENR
jgi:uncharacterized protein YndB with AHSA1/START domain